MTNKHKVFTTLPRRKRRARVQHIKNLIHRERHRCGGTFYDDCDIEIATASGNWAWSDILFTSANPAVYWNAEIITAGQCFADCVEQIAFDEAWGMLNEAQRNREASIEAISHNEHYPQFGGLTWSDYAAKREKEIARDNPPAVHCGYRILPGYAGGIGLQMIVDAEVLTVEVIEAAIADFRAKGEREWVAETPCEIPDRIKHGSTQLLAARPLVTPVK